MRSDERRIGLVRITPDVLDAPSGFAWIFDGAMVLRIDEDTYRKQLTYIFWHPALDILPVGEAIPAYMPCEGESDPVRKWVRMDGARAQ